jgi:hypothetical protein
MCCVSRGGDWSENGIYITLVVVAIISNYLFLMNFMLRYPAGEWQVVT